MENTDLSKEQLVEQVSKLQDRINKLEKTTPVQNLTNDALGISEKNLSAIIENNADGIVIVDTEGTVLYVNPAAEKLFGRSKDDFLGYPFGIPVSTDKTTDTLTVKNGNLYFDVEMRIVKVVWHKKPAYQLSIRDITERKLSEKALKASEEKCKVIFDNANDGMILVDLETRKFFMCNASCALMLGYQQEEFPNLEIADIHPAEDLPFIYEQIGIFSRGEKGKRSDIRFRRKNGDIFSTDLSPTLITFAGKNYLLMIFRDITERKQSEDALRESEEKFKSITENSADAIFIADQNGKYIYTNKAVTTMLGFSSEEIRSKTIIDLAPENKVDEYLGIFKDLLVKGKIFTEIELLKSDSTYISTDLNAVLLPNGMVYCSCRDISERKIAEKEIQSVAKFPSENPNPVIRLDSNGIILYANEASEKLLQNWGCTVGDTAPEFWCNTTAKDLLTGHENEIEVKYGQQFYSFYVVPIKNEGYVNLYARDITKRKQGEIELYEALDKAEESDLLKTAFLHNISHEIRTPLNAIVGFSGLLSNPDLPPEKRKYFAEIINQSSDQLLSIISDIVSIASIEAGQEKIQENEININLVCKLLNEQFIHKASEKAVTLRLQNIFADDKAIIITDATKLTQILTNLIGNALKFTPQGYVSFGYALKDNQLEFYVEDSGIGIPLDMQEVIFNRFRQVENNATREFGGSGLGLSISKAYVEMLGGKMWLTSEVNKGSVFYFTIPYKRVVPKELPDIPLINGLSFEIKKPITVLIAEDEDSNFILLEELLSDVELNLVRAVNGIEAVELCKLNPHIDLVLMDIKMPEMNGYKATIQIKKLRPDLPIIAQTAYSTEHDRSKALACGCSDFISKPIKRELLLSKINEQLLK